MEQLELQLEELEETSAEKEVAGELSTPIPTLAVTPRKPARRPLPEALPRERIVHPGPCACDRCGGSALRKIGEDVLESLECEPRRWKVVQHVREKFAWSLLRGGEPDTGAVPSDPAGAGWAEPAGHGAGQKICSASAVAQANAYSGYAGLYDPARKPSPLQ